MTRLSGTIMALAGAILLASPALAGDCTPAGRCAPEPTPVPEPSDFAIFAGGVAALLIRQWSSRRAARRDTDRHGNEEQR